MAEARFRLGDHEFYLPTEDAPLSRLTQKKRAPIKGAQPPSFLQGCTREPATSKAAKELLKGKFCGHGEPTFTVFDIVCGGSDELDVVAWMPEDDADGPDPEVLLARAAGSAGPWLVVFDRSWQDESGDFHLPATPEWRQLDEETEAEATGEAERACLSVGFEYPCDAESVDVVSWFTIDGWPQGHRGAPAVLVDREML